MPMPNPTEWGADVSDAHKRKTLLERFERESTRYDDARAVHDRLAKKEDAARHATFEAGRLMSSAEQARDQAAAELSALLTKEER